MKLRNGILIFFPFYSKHRLALPIQRAPCANHDRDQHVQIGTRNHMLPERQIS